MFRSALSSGEDDGRDATAFDFGRLDRIPKSHIGALHLVHENFVRGLAASLSAYLRSYVVLNLVSLEQVSYEEFLCAVPSPACIAYIGLEPFDGTALIEMNLTLMFRLVEVLLGSKAKSTQVIHRTMTDIEKTLVQMLMKILVRDLSEAWKSVADINFYVQSLTSEPNLHHVLASAEAVVVIAIEMRVESTAGLINLAIPSIFIKRLRGKFDQLRQVRRAESTLRDQTHVAQLLREAKLDFEAKIDAGTITTRELFNLKVDDVIALDVPVGREMNGALNGRNKWLGTLVAKDDTLNFQVSGESQEAD